MTKEELLKIALSGRINKTYEQSLGFDEAHKFLDAFNLKVNQGKHIPVWIVYLFYFRWVRASGIQPERYSKFVKTMGRYTRSVAWSCTKSKPHRHFRSYKILGFPSFTLEDEKKARKLISGQKARIRANKIPKYKRQKS